MLMHNIRRSVQWDKVEVVDPYTGLITRLTTSNGNCSCTGSVGWKKWPGDEAKLGLEKACTVT